MASLGGGTIASGDTLQGLIPDLKLLLWLNLERTRCGMMEAVSRRQLTRSSQRRWLKTSSDFFPVKIGWHPSVAAPDDVTNPSDATEMNHSDSPNLPRPLQQKCPNKLTLAAAWGCTYKFSEVRGGDVGAYIQQYFTNIIINCHCIFQFLYTVMLRWRLSSLWDANSECIMRKRCQIATLSLWDWEPSS